MRHDENDSRIHPKAAKAQQPISQAVPIVFVPALLGTELLRKSKDDGEYESVYVTPSIGLNLKTPVISLPTKWRNTNDSLPVQEKDDIIPGKVLEKIQLNCCCNITLIDQYSTFCRHFAECHSNFYTFNYDWRRDLNETTDKLIKFLEDISLSHGSAQVISHSMGCLISLAALKARPSIFHSALFVGGNFGGGAGFYPTNTIVSSSLVINIIFKNRMGSMFTECANDYVLIIGQFVSSIIVF